MCKALKDVQVLGKDLRFERENEVEDVYATMPVGRHEVVGIE